MAQSLFYGGSGRRAVAHTRPAFPKMPTAPSAFPLLGAPQAPGDEPNPPEGGKSLGERPPETEGNYPAAKTHSARFVPAASTASQNATQQLEKHSIITAAAPLLPVLGYYYASNIVMEESMMQVVSVSQQCSKLFPLLIGLKIWVRILCM